MRLATRVRVAAVGVIVVVAGIAAWWRFGPGSSTPAATAGPPPQYVDETAESGLVHTYAGSSDFEVGGGVAVFDCNDDGLPDVYLAGGERPAGLFRNDSPVGGSLAFTPLPDPVTNLTSVNGAYPIDIDGDGNADLVVLRNGGNVVLRGLGGCRFADVTPQWGIDPGTSHTEAFSATWEGGSSWPTLAFGNYVDPAIKDPTAWCEENQLVRPAAGGAGFAAPVTLMPSWCALSMLFSDWDGSGRMDLRVSNDEHYYPANAGQEQLWRIEPGRPPRLYTAAEGWAEVQVQGMGIASYDLTGDGLPEVYLTSQAANRLQTLSAGPSQPAYHDIGLQHRVNVAHPFTGADQAFPSTAWHPEFADVNDDGLIDLFVSKGNVDAQPDYAKQDPSDLLLGQPDGTFIEAADRAGILTFDRGRGAAVVDLNLDGRLDLLEAFYGAPVRAWRNAGPASTNGTGSAAAHWVALRLEQPGPNVDAIGARIEVRSGDQVSRREVTIGGGHAGGELGWIHFGLGSASAADVRVTWPDGQVGPWQRVDVDGFAIVDRGASAVRPWQSAP
jgi:enediyne biosynthesis protein E4